MFAMQRDRSSSGSSTRSTSSSRSLSLSPSGWNPARAAISPATTTTTPLSSSPAENTDSLAPIPHHRALLRKAGARQHETFAPSSAFNSYAYPCWPAGDSLGSTPRASGSSRIAQAYTGGYAPPSSRISDDDLECLDFSKPAHQDISVQEVGAVGISWSQVGTGAVIAEPQLPERKKRGPPPGGLVMERRPSDKGGKRRRFPRTKSN